MKNIFINAAVAVVFGAAGLLAGHDFLAPQAYIKMHSNGILYNADLVNVRMVLNGVDGVTVSQNYFRFEPSWVEKALLTPPAPLSCMRIDGKTYVNCADGEAALTKSN